MDLDTRAIQAKGMTPADVINAISSQNLVLPSGTAKFNDTEYNISLNSSPTTLAGLNNIPVKTVNGATTFLREVAHVRDGFSPQTNIVKQNGQRGLLLSVYKNGGASTIDVVNNLKAKLPTLLPLLPKSVEVTLLADQSTFVKTAVTGVIHEALIAAAPHGADVTAVSGETGAPLRLLPFLSRYQYFHRSCCCMWWARLSIS